MADAERVFVLLIGSGEQSATSGSCRAGRRRTKAGAAAGARRMLCVAEPLRSFTEAQPWPTSSVPE